MTKKKTTLLLATVVFASLVGVARATRRVAAWGGVPSAPSCFVVSQGQPTHVTNVCDHPPGVLYSIPLPYDSSGSKTATVTINGTSATHCALLAENRDGTGQVVSSVKGGAGFGTWKAVSLGPITAPSNGQLYVNCSVELNGSLSTVQYNQ
jgi:hypothetical protein